jgi:hypothetical protein
LKFIQKDCLWYVRPLQGEGCEEFVSMRFAEVVLLIA